MWCDNCLLLLPLRSGTMAWALLIAGAYIYFTYPEWQIYGGIGLLVALVALINMLALANRSYLWTRAIIIISAIRAIFMIECANGRQLWPASAAAGYGGKTALPSTFCTAGFPSLYAAFIVSLIVGLAFQLYMFFLTWRYGKLLEDYAGMKATGNGGCPNMSLTRASVLCRLTL
ncbi:hypothetical protein BKA93DRAFT_815689 [Sparassis latifolia]